MASKSFQDLKVWRNAHQLVLEIFSLTKKFPEDERYVLVSQFRRAVLSIPANIAEGSKKTQKDFVRFLDIAQGSLEATKYYLILSKDLKYFSEKTYEGLMLKSNEIGKMLSGLRNKVYQDLHA